MYRLSNTFPTVYFFQEEDISREEKFISSEERKISSEESNETSEESNDKSEVFPISHVENKK